MGIVAWVGSSARISGIWGAHSGSRFHARHPPSCEQDTSPSARPAHRVVGCRACDGRLPRSRIPTQGATPSPSSQDRRFDARHLLVIRRLQPRLRPRRSHPPLQRALPRHRASIISTVRPPPSPPPLPSPPTHHANADLLTPCTAPASPSPGDISDRGPFQCQIRRACCR